MLALAALEDWYITGLDVRSVEDAKYVDRQLCQ